MRYWIVIFFIFLLGVFIICCLHTPHEYIPSESYIPSGFTHYIVVGADSSVIEPVNTDLRIYGDYWFNKPITL
jgi:hypothetical protein